MSDGSGLDDVGDCMFEMIISCLIIVNLCLKKNYI